VAAAEAFSSLCAVAAAEDEDEDGALGAAGVDALGSLELLERPCSANSQTPASSTTAAKAIWKGREI
jgi:hypothetical protein